MEGFLINGAQARTHGGKMAHVALGAEAAWTTLASVVGGHRKRQHSTRRWRGGDGVTRRGGPRTRCSSTTQGDKADSSVAGSNNEGGKVGRRVAMAGGGAAALSLSHLRPLPAVGRCKLDPSLKAPRFQPSNLRVHTLLSILT